MKEMGSYPTDPEKILGSNAQTHISDNTVETMAILSKILLTHK